MKWLLLIAGIAAEVSGTTCMKLSDGFSKPLPSVLTFVFWAAALAVFMLALKRFDLSFAYALWAGIGILLVSIIGMVWFKEPVNALKITSIILIAAGAVGLNIGEFIS